ncbi:ABC transporter permease [Acidisphaera sp. L21]|uniref:ABC transporter permease n=1 Tax=Acidisphaera sp. L21 TaxID=1641851 RepID=UPI00131BDDAF|nr:ABC transporter permease [Acidisphaera sp. L21]
MRVATAGLLLVVLACLLAPLYASRVAGVDPFRSNVQGTTLRAGYPQAVLAQNTAGLGLGATPIGPGWSRAYLLGADGQGRDVAARLLYGGRLSLFIAAGATSVTLLLACLVGVAAGALGGVVDAVLRWLLDMLWAFPVFLLAISLSAVLAASDAGNPLLTIAILGAVYIPYVARPVRAQVLTLLEAEFVQAAVSLGGGPLHILRRHILPHVGRTLLLFAPTVMAFALLTEASLSVLGVGVQPPDASWGTLIADGQGLIYSRPVVAVAPGLAVVVTVLLLNRLADGLRR